ncbi:hypothetical protein LTR10_014958 [Elasticomyces elasticus]|nr:hypothetical protein LTR10_014958 [Elasticomyces elasticus]KAK4964535.1 hypothetical protein LTR42_012831 [Elasticomyces elasticus]
MKHIHFELQIAPKPGTAHWTWRPSDLYTYIDQLKDFLKESTPTLQTLRINIDDRCVNRYTLMVRRSNAVLTVDAYEKELKQLRNVLRSLSVPVVLLMFKKVQHYVKTMSYLSVRRAVFCRQEHEGIWFQEKGDAAGER